MIRLGALATAGGITFSFLLIALSLVILKWFGATLGWGIQFQQPWFLAGMATVTVLFAASFFELFPIAVPSSMVALALGRTHHLVLEAFLAGAFATLLATPCSAPFVGTVATPVTPALAMSLMRRSTWQRQPAMVSAPAA